MKKAGAKKDGGRVWTAEQAEAVNSPARKILASASAGSGKTAVITARAARLIAEGVSPDALVIVTFTVNAAEEMKGRLRDILERRGDSGGVSALRFAEIGTLHSFCANLIRRYFFKLGLDPAFVVADEAEASVLKLKSAAETVEKYLADGADGAPELTDRLSRGRGDEVLKALLPKIHEFSFNSANPGGWLDGAHKTAERFGEDEEAALVKLLCEMTRFYADVYARKKEERGALDFTDLEAFALKLLRDPETAADARARYRHIFVDEYQDINPLQEELIRALSDGGALFAAGDCKQSIYGFRACSPRIFTERAADRANNTVINLNANFRSRPEILRYCDDLFSALMTPSFGGADYAGEARFTAAADFGRPVSDYPAVSCRVALLPKGVRGTEAAARREAAVIAGALAALTGEKIYARAEGGAEGREARRAVYGDAVILVRRLNGAYTRALIRALRDLGVPLSLPPLKGGDTPFARLFADFLRVIDNPRQDIPLAAVMRGVFFKFTDNELADIRLTVGRDVEFFHEAVFGRETPGGVELSEKKASEGKTRGNEPPRGRRSAALEKKVVEFAETLRELREISRLMPFTDFAEYLAARFDCRRYAALAFGADAAEAFDGFLGGIREGGARTASEFLSRPAPQGIRDGGEPASGGKGLVRVMTVHKAKGTEYPLVFFSALGDSFVYRESDSVIMNKTAGIALRPAEGDGADGGSFSEILALNRREEAEEEIRVLYVALTRAQNHLILTGAAADGAPPRGAEDAKCFLDYIRAVRGGGCVYVEETPGGSDAGVPPVAAGAAARVKKKSSALIGGDGGAAFAAERRAGTPVKTTVTALQRAAAGNGGDVFEAEEKFNPRVEDGEVEPRFTSDVGSAYHEVLARVGFDCPRDDLAEELERIKKTGVLGAAADAVSPRVLERFFDGGLPRRALAAEKYYREKSFLMKKDGTIIQGTVDLLIIERDSVAVVDYKWSSKSAAELKKGYGVQLSLYAEAARRAFKRPVSAFLYSLNEGKLIKV